MVLDGMPSREYPINVGFLQGSISGPTLFLLRINDLLEDADDIVLYSKYDHTYDLWQQLELASELEYDLRETVDWVRKFLIDFNTGKTQLILFDRSNNSVAIDVKIDTYVL